MRVLLVHNPKAGGGTEVDRIVSLAERAGHEVQEQSVKENEWARALEADFDLVVAAGGDGTVCDVFKALAGSGHTATLVPEGTANNIARSLGLAEEDPALLIENWARGRLARFDLGRLTWNGGEEVFVESIGGGLFAAHLDRAETAERGDENKVEFGLRNLAGLVQEAVADEWGVVADGRDLSGRFLGVDVMNIRETGPNLPVASAAETGDGLLDLALIGEEHRFPLHAYVESRLAGGPIQAPPFAVVRARRVDLTPPAETLIRIDDEIAARDADEPVTALVDGAVRVLLPI
jgi:diacylglycerol kinase family enzyme